MDPDTVERKYGEEAIVKLRNPQGPDPFKFLLKLALSPPIPQVLKYPIDCVWGRYGNASWGSEPHGLLELDSHAQKAFETFRRDFPTSIWTFCASRCFARAAVLPDLCSTFNAVYKIYRMAEGLHESTEKADELLQSRKRDIGVHLLFTHRCREQIMRMTPASDEKNALKS